MEYPASIEVRTPDRVANWRPLVQWIMAIPHLVVAWVLQIVASVIALISWFAIVFTGRLPAELAEFQALILRYVNRAQIYAGFLHEEFPPFDFTTSNDEPGGTPVDVSFQPRIDGRNRLTVGLRFIWVIPAMFYAFVIAIVGSICWFLGFFAVLFTGRWPDGLHLWVVRHLRVAVRLNAYALLLTDDYPPFSPD